MSDVIIIGAGITGLSCAWRLKRLGIESIILESSHRAGGVIQSERVGGYLIERGPNSLRPSAENLALLKEAGLLTEILEGDRRAPRFVCLGHTLRKVPFGPMSIGGLLRAASEPFIRSKSPSDESVHDFFTRRLGREAEQRLVSPFVTGIYAGDTRTLSMAAAFPQQARMEREHGSLVAGMIKSRKPKGTYRGHTSSFADGMETLPRRLAANADITYGVRDVLVGRNLEVTGSFGKHLARAVVITAPAYAAAQMLEQSHSKTARLLTNVDYAPMVVAISSIPDSAFPRPLKGFGFLVPRTEKLHLLGTLFSSALFPGRAPQGRQLLTSFVGGALEREALDWTDKRIWEIVRSELQSILKTSAAPEPVQLLRHSHAIPQYKIGYERWTASLKSELKSTAGLFLAGNYLDGVSIAACIENGERVAHDVAAFIGSK